MDSCGTTASVWPWGPLGMGYHISTVAEMGMRKLWIWYFAIAVLNSSSASAINTHKKWDGRQNVYIFGCIATSTYGQVITIPAGVHQMNEFRFWWGGLSTGSMVVRGEVYAWDGNKATGSALYESAPKTIAFRPN